MHDRTGDLRQWHEDKRPLVQSRMRYHQPRIVDDKIVVEEQVEVERARRVAERARATKRGLDLVQSFQESTGWQLRLEPRRGVQKRRLVRVADGVGVEERRHGFD